MKDYKILCIERKSDGEMIAVGSEVMLKGELVTVDEILVENGTLVLWVERDVKGKEYIKIDPPELNKD
jgi:hypothetical protein